PGQGRVPRRQLAVLAFAGAVGAAVHGIEAEGERAIAARGVPVSLGAEGAEAAAFDRDPAEAPGFGLPPHEIDGAGERIAALEEPRRALEQLDTLDVE